MKMFIVLFIVYPIFIFTLAALIGYLSNNC